MDGSICCFMPAFQERDAMHIINLVSESHCPATAAERPLATFRLHMIRAGYGRIRTPAGLFPLQPGDLLWMPPAVPFAIENTDGLEYLYISFLGGRANRLKEQLRLKYSGEVFSGYEALLPLWQSAFGVSDGISNDRCEGILLYTLSEIGRNRLVPSPTFHEATAGERIKLYIDEHFSDGALSLESIGAALGYHPKYVSAAFKQEFAVGIREYLREVRVQQACNLIQQGFTALKDIAPQCGFSDPLYFSTVFKAQMGATPKAYMESLHKLP